MASMSKEPVVPQNGPTMEELGLTNAYFVAENELSKSKAAVTEASDWSNLSLGALKQKTENELREYLESKGLLKEDEKERPLAKSDLLTLVMTTA